MIKNDYNFYKFRWEYLKKTLNEIANDTQYKWYDIMDIIFVLSFMEELEGDYNYENF